MHVSGNENGVNTLDISQLARRVAAKRANEGLSVRQAAEAAGVSFSTISRVEAGTQPDLATFINLCGWIGADPGDFTGRPPARIGGVEDAITHLTSDPRLTAAAGQTIAAVVRDMYAVLANTDDTNVITAHLRAAPMLRAGVPERLAGLLGDMQEELRRRTQPHGS